MARRVVYDSQPDFSGGINLSADSSKLARNEVREARNARLDEFLSITKRRGTRRVSAAPPVEAFVQGGFGWVQSGTSIQQLVVSDGTLYTGTYSLPMSWQERTGVLSDTAYPSFAGFRDGSGEVCYIADGGPLNKWNGTTLTIDIANTPNCRVLEVYNQRLYGITGSDQYIYFSGLNNGDSLGIAASGGGQAVIRTFGNQFNVGLAAVGGSLFVFHRNSVSRFTGWSQDDISIDVGTQGVSADVGSIAPRSIVVADGVAYFLSDRGIYALNEAGVTPIGQKLEPLYEDIDKTDLNLIQGVHNRAFREVLFYFPGKGMYAFNYRLNAWTGPWEDIYTSDPVTAMWSTDTDDTDPIVLTGSSSGNVRLADDVGFRDDVLSNGSEGTAYTMRVQCRRFFFGSPVSEKSLRYLYVNSNLRGSALGQLSWINETASGTHTLRTSSFGLWGFGTWGSGTWGGSTVPVVQRVHAWGRGVFTDVSIIDGGTSGSVFSRIDAHGFDMGPRF